MSYEVNQYPGWIEAMSPIHHGGDEKTGSTPVLRSITHWDPNQKTHVRLPILSGNAIRGFCRRLLMRDMLAQLGFEVSGKMLHHFLMSGGILESTDETTGKMDLAFRRELRDTFPAIAVLGGSIGNQIIDGCLRVGLGVPVCSEYAYYLRDDLNDDPRAGMSIRTFTDISFATRKDDLRDRAEDEQATQMLIEFEVLISGTKFQHDFTLVAASDLERSCFGRMIELWRREPRVGGKSATGYGLVRFEYDGLPSSDLYLSYLAEQKEQISERLSALEKAAK